LAQNYTRNLWLGRYSKWSPSAAWGNICVPKPELGNEKKS
jgi:hypothetical protein